MQGDRHILRALRPLSPLPTGIPPRGRLKAPPRACLFDIYGTLLISGSGDIGIACREGRQADIQDLMSAAGIAGHSEDAGRRMLAAVEERHRALKRKGIAHPEVEIDRIWMEVLDCGDRERVRRFALAYEMAVNPVYPMPHLRQMLAVCRRESVVMGIVSNAQFYTPWILEALLKGTEAEAGFHPDLLFYSYRVGRAKPSPHMFRLAARMLAELGIAPREVLYLGNDMRNDVLPARDTGFRTALFAGDRRSLRLRENDPRCREVKPDLVVTDLRQVGAVWNRKL